MWCYRDGSPNRLRSLLSLAAGKEPITYAPFTELLYNINNKSNTFGMDTTLHRVHVLTRQRLGRCCGELAGRERSNWSLNHVLVCGIVQCLANAQLF